MTARSTASYIEKMEQGQVEEATLWLRLKGLYFHQIADRTKQFEFRLDTAYWLIDRPYDRVVVTQGYPKADALDRHRVRPWRGYEMQTISHPHFRSAPVRVFAIRVNE